MSEHHHTSAATEQPRGMEPILNSLMQATLDVTTTSRPALRKRFEEILRGQVRDAAQQPRGYLYTLRGTESYCPTRLPQCIALGWHEIPLYEGARCSGSTSVSKTEGDGSIPSASATAQCSAEKAQPFSAKENLREVVAQVRADVDNAMRLDLAKRVETTPVDGKFGTRLFAMSDDERDLVVRLLRGEPQEVVKP
jgi:hypothetical protein